MGLPMATHLVEAGYQLIVHDVRRESCAALEAKGARYAASPAAVGDAVEPVLKHIGKVFFIGERPGMGQTMKLCNNLLSATATAASSEAVVFGVKAGLDPTTMVDVINAGSGRNTATEAKFPKSILPRTFDFGFAMGLMYKDVKLCLEEAEAAGAPMRIASAVREVWKLANDEIGPEK